MQAEHRLTFTVNVPYTLVMLLVLAVHLVFLLFSLPSFNFLKLTSPRSQEKRQATVLNIRQIRTLGKKDGSKRNNVLVTPEKAPTLPKQPIDPFKAAAAMNQPVMPKEPPKVAKVERTHSPYLPTRPPSALERLATQAKPVQEVAATTSQAGGQATIVNSPTLSKSRVNMQVEVPEGVAADELNAYELMFYGFQKRMMEKYLGAIMLQVREYERKYPHRSLIPPGEHVMTGRVTFDTRGNIKQIKMVRWTQAEVLQGMFEEVLKSMDSVPNPPHQLWEKNGEFTVFYNLTVVNG